MLITLKRLIVSFDGIISKAYNDSVTIKPNILGFDDSSLDSQYKDKIRSTISRSTIMPMISMPPTISKHTIRSVLSKENDFFEAWEGKKNYIKKQMKSDKKKYDEFKKKYDEFNKKELKGKQFEKFTSSIEDISFIYRNKTDSLLNTLEDHYKKITSSSSDYNDLNRLKKLHLRQLIYEYELKSLEEFQANLTLLDVTQCVRGNSTKIKK